ncbi:MAG: FAD-dependent thymidylate synthase [Candidatus Goldbacteria bacterium]|nr:FAD-dependent thymidylate synthase [Candidatus Goldiibacteriota bacterium]
MLEVKLAGFNIDYDALEKLKKFGWDGKDNLTPETISAAYARISRDPRPVNQLRKEAREEVDKARKSNENIVFKMGHHSVAEHAYLNFDILGISRLAVESLEEARLCSYTEKSQRYITLEGDYVIPEEFNEKEKNLFRKIVGLQVDAYNKVLPVLHEYQKKINIDKLNTKSGQNMVEGWAKEDARYMVCLATECQLGFSTNARNLEYILRKLKYNPLSEVRRLSRILYDRAKKVVPSLIILSDPVAFKKQFGWEVSDGFLKTGLEKIEMISKNIKIVSKKTSQTEREVNLFDWTDNIDEKIIAGLLYQKGNMNYSQCLSSVKNIDKKKRKKIFKMFFEGFTEYDSMPRQFEFINFCFELIISASAFAQLKRHRMMTIIKQPYDINLGITIPPSILITNQEKILKDIIKKTENLYEKLYKKNKHAAAYVLTNAHRRKVLININLRELYHLARLRMDSHAQWDIQNIVTSMVEAVKRVAPLSGALLCGKDEFKKYYEKFINS